MFLVSVLYKCRTLEKKLMMTNLCCMDQLQLAWPLKQSLKCTLRMQG